MTRSIDNNDDIIDSRDVIDRIAELDQIRADDPQYLPTESEYTEYMALVRLAGEGEEYAEDWAYGVPLIRDSYFLEYAQELADDIGAVPADATWPMTCIDWAQAARELQQDYTSADFAGVTYWVR